MANFVDGALQSTAQAGNRCTFFSPALLVRRLLCITADLLLFSSRTDFVSASSPISVTQSHINLSNGNRSWLTQFCSVSWAFFPLFLHQNGLRTDFWKLWLLLQKRGRGQAVDETDFQGVHQFKTSEQFCMWEWESSLSASLDAQCAAGTRNEISVKCSPCLKPQDKEYPPFSSQTCWAQCWGEVNHFIHLNASGQMLRL